MEIYLIITVQLISQVRNKIPHFHSVIESAASAAAAAEDHARNSRMKPTSAQSVASTSIFSKGLNARLKSAARKGRVAALFADAVHISQASLEDYDPNKSA